jgi:hypothetical protein
VARAEKKEEAAFGDAVGAKLGGPIDKWYGLAYALQQFPGPLEVLL